MKMTLLEIVQTVCSELGLDNISSLGDSPDAERVSTLAKTSFYEFINQRSSWPHLQTYRSLEASVDVDLPNGFIMPDDAVELRWFKYDTSDAADLTKMRELCYLTPECFVEHVTGRSEHSTYDYQTIHLPNHLSLRVRKDKAPEYWTSFDDKWIITDSYDSSQGSTLVSARSQALYIRSPRWMYADEFVPDLPTDCFSAYLAEVRSLASVAILETENAKAEQQANRGRRVLSNKNWVTHETQTEYPNYGRQGRGRGRSRLFGR